jgi:biopolymer transport protein TolR
MPRPRKSINQINVVPYIDVMLVLLIIFMVTAPLINPGTIELPSVASQLPVRAVPPMEITVRTDHSMWLRDTAIGNDKPRRLAQDQIVASVKARLDQEKEKGVVIAADKSVRYQEVIDLIDALKRSGVARVGLVAQSGK